MAASDDIYFDYYSSESLSYKWGTKPPSPSRRIQIIPPNAIDTKSSSIGGPPKYHPSSLSHTQQKLFRQKLLYVAPLAYYALRTLRPWCFGIDINEETLSAWVSVSTAEGEEQANLGDIIAPWAKGDISLLDPPTWAFLTRLYNGLPEHYSRYRLALNDPYLPMLSTIPSTPNFSIITVLDLSGCDDLHDSNVSQLKVLTNLCVLDTSCTHLTDQAVRNLMSTLLLQEPGPLHLQSWSLRNCAGVTNRAIESLGYFPMLCLLDLRGTSVKSQQLQYRLLNWGLDTIRYPQKHFDLFWPQPQSNIPSLIQGLRNAAYSTRTESHEPTDKSQKPWIVHIDRQYPSDWGVHRMPHWKSTRPNHDLPWYSYEYSDEEVFDEDEFSANGGSLRGDSDSGESLETEETDLSQGEFDPSSPLEPTSSIIGDNELLPPPRLDSTSMTAGVNEISDYNVDETQSPLARALPVATFQSSSTSPNQLVAEFVALESAPEPGVPHFYDARTQAGLAPPKARKRRRRYSSASSESYDSDEEREKEEKMEAELRRTLVESVTDHDWQLMLLREPPEWVETETLVAAIRTRRQNQFQNVPTQPDLSFAKKRKVDAGGMAARWARMKASGKASSQAPSQSITPHHSGPTSSTANSQTHIPARQIASTKEDRVQVRRTTIGRAPRLPGAILRKP